MRLVLVSTLLQCWNVADEVDPAGKVLAAGTPERVVRLWDPRAGDQSVGKLVGHNDCVRSIVLSEDGRYVSASR
jgi:WD40 repeat protein